MHLYYLPGMAHDTKVADLAPLHLTSCFDKNRLICRGCANGPDGESGVVVSNTVLTDDDNRVGYYPDAQKWQSFNGGRLWVGAYHEPHNPSDFARKYQLRGYPVQLGDGHEWMCPTARAIVPEDDALKWLCALPECVDLDDGGKWVRNAVVSRYRGLWQYACDFWDRMTQGNVIDGELRFSFEDMADAALEALTANYYLSRWDVAFLGLFDSDSTQRIMEALIDWPTLIAWQEKKSVAGQDGSNSEPTYQGDSPIPQP